MWARPGRNTSTAPSTSANCGDFSGKEQKRIIRAEIPKQKVDMGRWGGGGGRTDVTNELDQQVHVDLIRVHELQHLPGSAAEVIQIRTEVPSGTRVFQDHLLDQTQRQRSAHHRHFLLRGGWSEDGT